MVMVCAREFEVKIPLLAGRFNSNFLCAKNKIFGYEAFDSRLVQCYFTNSSFHQSNTKSHKYFSIFG